MESQLTYVAFNSNARPKPLRRLLSRSYAVFRRGGEFRVTDRELEWARLTAAEFRAELPGAWLMRRHATTREWSFAFQGSARSSSPPPESSA